MSDGKDGKEIGNPNARVFCGNLPFDTPKSKIEELFEPFGKLVDVRMVKTYSFVDYESREDAEKAVKELNPHRMGGRLLTIKVADGRERVPTTVFVGNLPDCTSEELLERFEKYGEIKQHKKVKTYAFLDFVNRKDAGKCCKEEHRTKWGDKTISVEFSEKDKKEQGSGAGGKRDRRDEPSNVGNFLGALSNPLGMLGALTGGLPMQEPMPAPISTIPTGPGPTPLDNAVVIYERYFVDPNHPLLKGLPLPKMAR